MECDNNSIESEDYLKWLTFLPFKRDQTRKNDKLLIINNWYYQSNRLSTRYIYLLSSEASYYPFYPIAKVVRRSAEEDLVFHYKETIKFIYLSKLKLT